MNQDNVLRDRAMTGGRSTGSDNTYHPGVRVGRGRGGVYSFANLRNRVITQDVYMQDTRNLVSYEGRVDERRGR